MKTVRITMANETYEELKKATKLYNERCGHQGENEWTLHDYILVPAMIKARDEVAIPKEVSEAL